MIFAVLSLRAAWEMHMDGHWKPAAGWLQQLRSYSFARAAVIARGVVLTRAQPKVQGELHVN